MLETITLENAIKLATPLAKKIFDVQIKPIISGKISQYFKNKSDINTFERESVKYISSATGQCSTINTIAFPNTPKKLDDLYIPLKISGENEVEIIVNDETDIFKHSKKILVCDTAGMGKSTLSKKIFLNIVKKQEYIPVFIVLRQLDNQPIANQIAAKFGVNSDRPEQFLSQLPLIYVLDGLDEVPAKDKSHTIAGIRKFIDELDDAKILITSRLESYLSEFYDFSRYRIIPLEEKEAYDLISKYDPEGKVSEKLISSISDSRERDLKKFLSTPLYVSLLFCAYRHKTVIPQKKHLFYSQVYEALFESHDLSKEIGFVRQKHSDLDSSDFHFLLRRLGFWCLKNGGKIEFQRDELEIIIQEIISNANGVNTSAASFVKDLTTTVPLFIKEGSSIRWSHKSLMEYFSSMFICHDAKDKQQSILLYLYHSDSWSSYKSIFELCADIDFGPLRASVVREAMERYLNYRDTNYKNIKNRRIKRQNIEERIGLSFYRNFGFKIIESDSHPIYSNNIWDDDSDDVIAVKNKCKDQSTVVSKYMISYAPDERAIFFISVLSREVMIIDILKYKRPDLFLTNTDDTGKTERKTYDYINALFITSSIKRNHLYIASDNPGDLLNNSNFFHIINHFMSISGGLVLNFSKVESELKSINEDSSNGVDKLIDGLH